MNLPFKSTIAALSIAATLLGLPASAEEAASPDQVLAQVNGVDITLGHVLMVRGGLPKQYAQYPADALFNGILEQLITQTLLMQNHDGNLARTSKLLIENERRAVIAGEVIQRVMGRPVDEQDVLKFYAAKYNNGDSNTEYKAAHILLETEEEAKDLAAKLAEGADFAEMAKAHSTGPSSEAGGELGWFTEGVMVQPFFEAVQKLKSGQISPPVQSQFGWHLILLEETRIKDAPKLEDVRQQIEGELQQAAYDDYVKQLEEAATIERADISKIDPNVVNNLKLLEN